MGSAKIRGRKAVSLSVTEHDLRSIDRRAESLGLNRSQYLLALAKRDLQEGSDFIMPVKCDGSSSGREERREH